MINKSLIHHLEKEKFDDPKETVIKCIKDYQLDHNPKAFKFEKGKFYSFAFANSVGVKINDFTMRCTTKKYYFKIVSLNQVQVQEESQDQEAVVQEAVMERMYRFEVGGYKPFRKGSQHTEKEITEANYNVDELYKAGVIILLK